MVELDPAKQLAALKDTLSSLAGELAGSSRDNRDMLAGLVRTEVERVAGRMGYVREDELAALRAQVQRLQAQVDALTGGHPAPAASPTSTPASPDAASANAPVDVPVDAPKPKKKIYLDPQDQRSEAQ